MSLDLVPPADEDDKTDYLKRFRPDITWPKEDVQKLLQLMESYIPPDDRVKYQTRLSKIDWENLAFGDHSVEDCKKMWDKLSTYIRRHRLLSELIDDAKHWLNNPWVSLLKKKKNNTHPDRPKKPCGPFAMFVKVNYHRRKETKEFRDLHKTERMKLLHQEFKELSPEELKKYRDLSRMDREEYNRKMKIFIHNHPEETTEDFKKKIKAFDNTVKLSAFKLFLDENITKAADAEETPLDELIRIHNKKWEEMNDIDKLEWFEKAKKSSHGSKGKIKDVPQNFNKPRNISIYNLYTKKIFASEEITKNLAPGERLKYIASKWKTVTDQEKSALMSEKLAILENTEKNKDNPTQTQKAVKKKRKKEDGENDNIVIKTEEFEIPIEFDMNSTEIKREDSMNEETDEGTPRKKRKKNHIMEDVQFSPVVAMDKGKDESIILESLLAKAPKLPTDNPMKLFKRDMKKKKIKYESEEALTEAWNSLASAERKAYKKRVKMLKDEYSKEYEEFLSSLTKKEKKMLKAVEQSSSS